MSDSRYLYVMISQTDTAIAQFIRTLSRYPYNHVSMTLDPELRTWCSFARYHQDAPFYSGFIKEPVERFLAKTGDAHVRIFRLSLSREKARRIEQLFLQAGRKETRLIYNYFDAIASLMNLKIAISGSYTCLSFACAVIGRQYKHIKDLNNALEPQLYYEGSLADLVPDSGSREDAYFQPIGFLQGNWHSAKQLALVTGRFLRHRRGDYVDQKLHSTVR
mgnify:CR=1 FL=1